MNSHDKHRILVITNHSLIAKYMIDEIQSLGHELVVLTTWSPKQRPLIERKDSYLPDVDIQTILALVQQWQITRAIYASTTCDAEALRQSAALAEALEQVGIPTVAHPSTLMDTVLDKSRCQAFLRNNGISVPKSNTAKGYQNIASVAKELEYPIVLKLLNRSGGVGMHVIDSYRTLKGLNSKLINEIYLAEKFIEGVEYSIEVLVNQKTVVPLAVIHKGQISDPVRHPMERTRIAPWTGSDAEAVRQLATEAAKILGGCGVLEFDIVVDGRGPKVLEINPRLGGVTFIGLALGGPASPSGLLQMALDYWPSCFVPVHKKNKIVLETPYISELNIEQIRDFQRHHYVYELASRSLPNSNGNVTLVAPNPPMLLQALDELASEGLEFLEIYNVKKLIQELT